MVKGEVVLSYKGHLSFETIGMLLNRLKTHSDGVGLTVLLYKKLLTVTIESLENIYKYNDSFENEAHLFPGYLPSFTLEKHESLYILTTSNPILKKDVPVLSDKITRINKLDSNGLKLLYKKTIANGQFSKKGGAGLGFIEMAKICKGELEYKFEDINEAFSFYSLKVYINTNLKDNQE